MLSFVICEEVSRHARRSRRQALSTGIDWWACTLRAKNGP
jgi:hypothetical protein